MVRAAQALTAEAQSMRLHELHPLDRQRLLDLASGMRQIDEWGRWIAAQIDAKLIVAVLSRRLIGTTRKVDAFSRACAQCPNVEGKSASQLSR